MTGAKRVGVLLHERQHLAEARRILPEALHLRRRDRPPLVVENDVPARSQSFVEQVEVVGDRDAAGDAGNAIDEALEIAQPPQRFFRDHRAGRAGTDDDVERQRAGDALVDRLMSDADGRARREIGEEVGVRLDPRYRQQRPGDEHGGDHEDGAPPNDVEARERRQDRAETTALAATDAAVTPIPPLGQELDHRRHQRHRQHEQQRDADHGVQSQRAHRLNGIQHQRREADHGGDAGHEHREAGLLERAVDRLARNRRRLELEIVARDDVGRVRAADDDEERRQHERAERDRLAHPPHDAHRPHHPDDHAEERQHDTAASAEREEQHRHHERQARGREGREVTPHERERVHLDVRDAGEEESLRTVASDVGDQPLERAVDPSRRRVVARGRPRGRCSPPRPGCRMRSGSRRRADCP